MRVSLGGMFFLHGIGKPLIVGMVQVSQGFIEKGFPVWANYAATLIEIIGGLILVSCQASNDVQAIFFGLVPKVGNRQ